MKKILLLNFNRKLLLLCLIALFSAFNVLAAPPIVTSFSPLSGPVGTTVTITGTGFNTVAANNIVFFGATKATVSAASATSLTVTVPLGASYNFINVLNTGTSQAANSLRPFITTFAGKGAITNADIQPAVGFAAGNPPRSVAVSDFDGDGKPDVVLLNVSSGNAGFISIYRNTATSGVINASSFAAKIDYAAGTNCLNIITGDLDGDGKPDIVVANGQGSGLSLYRNTSTSGNISFAAKVDFAVGAYTSAVRIADIDGDGKPEIVCVNNNAGAGNTVSVLRNTSTTGAIDATSFAAKVDFTVGTGCFGLSIGDLDGDGKPDLAISYNAVAATSNISILQNTSTTGVINASSFAAKVDFAVPAITGTFLSPHIILADFDGDGKLDIANSNTSPSTVSVFRNLITGPGTITTSSFDTRIDIATGASPRELTVGDIDGDGKPDLLVGGYFTSASSAIKNTSVSGTISFATRVDYTTGNRPACVAICDIDGDGISDLLAANANDLNFTVTRVSPINPSSNIIFTNTNATSTTATWTSGTAASRAVFVLAGSTGTPAPLINTTYTGNAAFKSGTQIGSTGWYCVYNGSGNSVTVTGLTSGTTYRFMTLEYNGSAGSELYLTTPATNNPNNVIPATPAIGATGTLSAFNTTYGTPPASGTFNVTGTNLSTGILVTPPNGFEVSADNVTFTSTVTIGTAGNTASTPVYIRLAATTPAGSYSGNVVLSSTGVANVNVATVTSTVTAAALTITANSVTKTQGATLSTTTGSTAFTSSGLKNTETIGSVTITYGSGSAAADPVNTYNGSVVASAATGGTFNAVNYSITYVSGNITVIAPVTPTISTTGSLSALNTPYGTPSAAITFNVSGVNLSSGILVTAPSGFEVSSNNVNFSSTVTIGSGGTIPSTAVYVRLSAAAPVASYSGNIVLSSNGAANVNVATVSSAVTLAPLTISASNVSKIYGSALAGGTGSAAFTATGLKNGQSIGSVTISYGTGALATAAVNTYTGSVSVSSATGGTFTPGNYSITYAAANIAVTPAGLTVTANNVSKNYGVSLTGGAGSSAFTAIGLQNGETIGSVSISYGAGSAATDASGSYPGSVAPSAATGGTFLSGNYTLTYVPGNITVIALLPSASTTAATAIKSSGAVIGGTANDNGTITNVSIQYSTSATLAGATTATLSTGTSPLPAGSGTTNFTSVLTGLNPLTTYYYRISASNVTGTVNGSILSFTTSSTNASLSNLTISAGSLTPSFSPGTYTYNAVLDNSVISTTVTPTLADLSASVTVNGVLVNSGSASGPIALGSGDNSIQVVVTAQDGVTKLYHTIVIARPLVPGSIVATNILSPNGDGVNDTWVIKDINRYPNNKVTVFDRSGRAVFSKRGYGNDWNGTLNGSPLSEDTYYYVISLSDNLDTVKGYITILRKR